jgi:hypothetical protein
MLQHVKVPGPLWTKSKADEMKTVQNKQLAQAKIKTNKVKQLW